jgi:hypothetical protein
MVTSAAGAFKRIRVPARPAQHVHRCDSRQATPDAPACTDHRRRYTGHDQQTRCRGSSGSASLPNKRLLDEPLFGFGEW